MQERVARYAREGRLGELPPILTFQSVIDFTVSTRAIITALYVHLPRNGSELVLFDINQAAKFGPLLRSATETVLTRILPPAPRNYRTTVITNASPDSAEVVARVTEAGETSEQTTPLDLVYPPDVFSLSHVALPFPMSDSLYGMQPDNSEDFGIKLGAMAVARRTGRAHPQPGFAAAGGVESVLSIRAPAHRRRYSLRSGGYSSRALS